MRAHFPSSENAALFLPRGEDADMTFNMHSQKQRMSLVVQERGEALHHDNERQTLR